MSHTVDRTIRRFRRTAGTQQAIGAGILQRMTCPMGRMPAIRASFVDDVNDRPSVGLVKTDETSAREMEAPEAPEYLHVRYPRQVPAGVVQETGLTAAGRPYSILTTRVA
jgi:hypothetical protein